MSRNIGRYLLGAIICVAIALTVAGSMRTSEAAQGDSVTARLQRLEDREQILELLTAYGATLDRRDFTAFGQLFAEDAEYGSGPGTPTRGRAAIQAQLEKVLASNPSKLATPNHHLFFNPSIQVDGDRATAHTLGAYTVPDAAAKPVPTTQLVFFVSYDDTLVRKAGRWLFQRRMIGSGAP
jgi:uncharacterized protein (TIGR02246 family)